MNFFALLLPKAMIVIFYVKIGKNMNELNNIENMMIELKDAVITDNESKINRVEHQIKAFLAQNSDYKNLSYIEMLMVSRLNYLFKTIKTNYEKQMVTFETFCELV